MTTDELRKCTEGDTVYLRNGQWQPGVIRYFGAFLTKKVRARWVRCAPWEATGAWIEHENGSDGYVSAYFLETQPQPTAEPAGSPI